MAFQFPASPTVGQIFTPIAGVSYKWDGQGWVPYSADLPAPLVGMNRIINGDFRFDQIKEGGTYTTAGSGIFGPDQWFFTDGGGAGHFSVKREADPDYAGEYNALITVTTVDSTMGVTDNYNIQTSIEGWNFADFLSGSAGAQQLTLSFEVKCSITGTFAITFKNNANNRSYVSTFTVNAANTVERKIITLTCDTSGTWETGNLVGVTVGISLGHGSNFYAPSANTWSAGSYWALSTTTNLISTAGATMRLKRFKVEKGAIATPFERRQYSQELALCQRYYFKTFDSGVAVAQNVGGSTGEWRFALFGGGVGLFTSIPYKVSMRTQPTITTYNPSAANAQVRNASTGTDCTLTAPNGASADHATIFCNSDAGAVGGQAGLIHITADARLT